MIEKLVVEFFKKVEEYEGIKSRNGKAHFLIHLILDKNEKEKEKDANHSRLTMSMSTASRLHEKYVEKKEGAELKNSFFKNTIAEYLGYINYSDFINKNIFKNVTSPINIIKPIESVEPKLQKNNPIKRTKKNKKNIILLSSIPLLGSLLFLYPSLKKSKSDCIIWTGKQYEKTLCSTYRAIKNNDLQINIHLFRRIEVNDDTEFFINGESIIWHGKNNNGIVEYFTTRGKHPETGDELDKITRYFLNKHGLLNE